MEIATAPVTLTQSAKDEISRLMNAEGFDTNQQ